MAKELLAIQKEDAAKMASGLDIPNYSLAGTGKTLSALEAHKLTGLNRGMVLAPPIALSMWEQNIKEHLGASVQVIRTGSAIKGNPDFVVTTFDLAGRSMRVQLYEYFGKGPPANLMLDEAHYLRRHTSQRSIGVFGERMDGNGGHVENFEQVWSLTGNPIWNHNDDIYSQLRALHGDVLRKYGVIRYEDFIRNFCILKVKQYHKNMPPRLTVIGSQNSATLSHIMYKDIKAIRRLEPEGLPDLVETKLYPKMGVVPAEYAKLVNSMSEQDLLKALLSPDDNMQMQKVWQAVALAKVKGSVDYLVDVARAGPVLIGVWHNSVGAAIADALEKAECSVERVYGATSHKKRDEIQDSFNAGNLDFVVGQMAAMGVSWNLQATCSRVVIAQDHPSPSVIEQFYKRVYRFGQTNTTFLDFLTSEHALDKTIEKMRLTREREQSIAHGA